MRVIITAKGRGTENVHLVVRVRDKKKMRKAKALIGRKKHAKAISHIMSNGKFVKAISGNNIHNETSDLILTPTNAYWSLL